MKALLLASLLVSYPINSFTCFSEKNVFPYFQLDFKPYDPPTPLGHFDVAMFLDLNYTDVFSYETVVLKQGTDEYFIDYPNGYFYMTKINKDYRGIFILFFEKETLEAKVTCHFK